MKNSIKTLKGISRYLTGMELQDMLAAYNRGASKIKAPRGQVLNRQDVEFIATYLEAF